MTRPVQTLLLASALFAGALTASAQVNVYTTNFGAGTTPDNNGNTYQPNNELTAGQTTTTSGGQNGWMTNDPDNNTTNAVNGSAIGGSDYVGTLAGFTGNAAYLGGGQRSTSAATDVVPGAATDFLYKNITVPSNAPVLTFNVDFDIAAAAGSGVSFTTKDSFGFVLRNTAGTQLVSINFATSSSRGTPANSDFAAGYTINGTGVGVGAANINASDAGVNFGQLYHLTISINTATNILNASLSNGTQIATNVSLAGAPISAKAVTQIAAAWTLTNNTPDANGAYTGAGGNLLGFDNYAITVPEPSTYAAMLTGLVALAWLGKVRRRA